MINDEIAARLKIISHFKAKAETQFKCIGQGLVYEDGACKAIIDRRIIELMEALQDMNIAY